jgi:hypothetical protein
METSQFTKKEDVPMGPSTNGSKPMSSGKLFYFYCNAAKTACGAIGHSKSWRNENLAKEYAAELTARNAPCPEYYEAAEMGDFNGPGSG